MKMIRCGWTCASLLTVMLCVVKPLEAATIYVPDGGDLQAALDAAQPGDTILLAQGAEFVGNFVLPNKTGEGWIILRSATPDAVLPADGARILPDYAPLLARLRSPTIDTAALRTNPGAHHWDIRYLEFAANPLGSGDLIQLGDGSAAQNTLDLVPHHIVLRHVYVHGDVDMGQKRCIALNAAEVTIADSYVSECKSPTQDSQAIGGWNGPGPYTIENNYLEAAGENIMFGGADPAIPNLVPSNILFRRNLVSRPMAWRSPIIPTPQNVVATLESGGSLPAGTYAYRVVARRLVANNSMGQSTASAEVTVTASGDLASAVRVTWDAVPGATEYRVYGRTSGTQTIYWTVTTTEFLDTGAAGTSGAVPTSAGTAWLVKNLFELKNASNVIVEDNIFENHWKDGQAGFAIVLTPRNSNGACSWCVVEGLQFRYNLVRNVGAGFNMLGYDSAPRVTRQTNNIDIFQNLFLMSTTLGGNGWFMQMGDEPRDVRIHHNTVVSNGNTVVYAYGGTCAAPRTILGFEYVANAARHGTYGLNSPCGSGNLTLNAYFPGNVFAWNYLAGASLTRYPSGTINVVPFEAQFVDAANGDYTVVEGSPLKRAALDTNPATDIGVDFPELMRRVDGVPNPPPPVLPIRPTATFTLTCTYLDCAFADQSVQGSAALAERLWTFGDGTSGSEASGVHTFAAAGTYTVTLLVRDVNGLEDSERMTVSVRPPNVAPTANFEFACVDLTCSFTDRSTDSDGTVSAWAWTFGGAGTSDLPSPSFAFAAPGTYDVSLTVTDNEGATSTTTAAVNVTAIIHAALVNSTTTVSTNRKWKVRATVAIHGANERPIKGATISATWTGISKATLSCVTGEDGLCTFDSGLLAASRTSATLTILNVSAPLSVYQWSANHDQTGTRTGMSWTFMKP